jgi:phosphatidylinositol-3-phosphatase
MKLLPSLAAVGASFVFACGGSASSGTPSAEPAQPGAGPSGAPSPAAPEPSAGTPAPPSDGGAPSEGGAKSQLTIFTIVMENHDYAEIVGSPNAPYINSLIASYGLATNYSDSGTHPSLPNYLTMISGAPQYPGLIDLNPTTLPFPVKQPNLGTQLQAAGVPWRSYQESMGAPCKLTGAGPYAPKHDPFLYFVDMQTGTKGLCAEKNVDYSSFPADLAAGAQRFMWITPNLTSDGHDPAGNPVAGLKASDAWASTEIPKILASSAYKNGGVIFLTWDEAENRSGPGSADKVPMIIISPNITSAGFKSTKAYSHKSYLATVEDLLGLPRLATVASEPSMAAEFLK